MLEKLGCRGIDDGKCCHLAITREKGGDTVLRTGESIPIQSFRSQSGVQRLKKGSHIGVPTRTES